MQTIRLVKKTEVDGSLSLRIPLGKPQAEYEVLVVVQPKEPSSPGDMPEKRDWPEGYLEQTYGSIDDDTFFRHPQGELSNAVDFD